MIPYIAGRGSLHQVNDVAAETADSLTPIKYRDRWPRKYTRPFSLFFWALGPGRIHAAAFARGFLPFWSAGPAAFFFSARRERGYPLLVACHTGPRFERRSLAIFFDFRTTRQILRQDVLHSCWVAKKVKQKHTCKCVLLLVT